MLSSEFTTLLSLICNYSLSIRRFLCQTKNWVSNYNKNIIVAHYLHPLKEQHEDMHKICWIYNMYTVVYFRTFQIIYFAVLYFATGDVYLVLPPQTQFSLFKENNVCFTYSVLPLKAIEPHTWYTNTADNVGNLDKQSTNSSGMQGQLLLSIQLRILHIHIKYYFNCTFVILVGQLVHISFFSLTIRCT